MRRDITSSIAFSALRLVDIFDHNTEEWKLGLVKGRDEQRSDRALVHYLYRPTAEDRWMNTKYLAPFGSRAYNGRNPQVLNVGDVVDVLIHQNRWSKGKLIDVEHSGLVPENEHYSLSEQEKFRVDLLPRKWLDVRSIRPSNYSSKHKHPDHQLVLDYFVLLKQNAETMTEETKFNNQNGSPRMARDVKYCVPEVNIHHDWNDEDENPCDSDINIDCDRVEGEEVKHAQYQRGILSESKHSGRDHPWLGRNAPARLRERVRGLCEEDPRFRRYKEKLSQLGYRVKTMEGDGNCLFRTVSHQVYGTPDYHDMVRKYCLDYMELEKDYFQPFIVGETEEDFKSYVAYKRQDGVWGDDIEIQAMCELYDRPAQIFAYDPVAGASQMRTFHEPSEGRQRPPMRLSFYGGGHYDSIIGPGHSENILLHAGSFEKNRIEMGHARKSGAKTNIRDGGSKEYGRISDYTELMNEELLEEAIRMSRQQYDDNGSQDIEQTLKESLQQAQLDELAHVDEVKQQSSVEADEKLDEMQALTLSDIAATEEAELEHALKISRGFNDDDWDQYQLKQALEMSKDEPGITRERVELEQALKLSKEDPSLKVEQSELEEALKRSEDEARMNKEQVELEEAIRLSQLSGLNNDIDKEQTDLAVALRLSKEESGHKSDEDIKQKLAQVEEENLRKAIEASLREN